MDAPYAVQLVVPALADSARLARLVAASLATDAGWTLDDTEDLRVAVSEMVALLVEGSEDAADQVELTYQRQPDAVEVEGRRDLANPGPAGEGPDGRPATALSAPDGPPAGAAATTPDDLALEILRVVVDEHQFTDDPSGRWFRLVKHPRQHP